MNNLRTILASAMLVFYGMAHAQDYFSVEGPKTNADASFADKAGFLFTSKSADLVISTNLKSDQQNPQGVKNAKGLYEYKMGLDVSSTKERNFTISKKGTAYRTSVVKKSLKAGMRYDYTINEVENYISLDPIGDLKELYTDNSTMSCIDFTTSLKNLKITFSSNLPATLTKKKAQSGADRYVLEINPKKLKELISSADQKQQEFAAMDKALYTDKTMELTEANMDRCDALQKEAEELAGRKAEALTIEVSVPGSNIKSVTVDDATLSAMCRPAGKVSFSVTPKTQKEYVDRFFSQYGELLHQAESHKASRNYDLAQQFYESAAKAKDASATDKAAATQAAQKMSELAVFKTETDELADKLYQLTKSNQRVNKQELFKLIDDIAVRYEALNKETGDENYLSEANRLRAEKSKVGTVFMGRFVMSEYSGGRLEETTITNVRIYGSQRSNCDEMDSPSFSDKGELITTITAADGRFNFMLKPGQYKTIIFEAVGNKNIKKNKHVSVEGTDKDRNIKIRFPKD